MWYELLIGIGKYVGWCIREVILKKNYIRELRKRNKLGGNEWRRGVVLWIEYEVIEWKGGVGIVVWILRDIYGM